MVKNNTWVIFGIIVLLALMVGLGIMVTRQTEEAANTDNTTQNEQNNDQTGTEPAADDPGPIGDSTDRVTEQRIVTIEDGEFSPNTLEISVGTIVTFKNSDSELRWPAVDPHPTHTGLAGFDAERALEPGESWSYQFDEAGTFRYHDHLNPSLRGTIVVK